MHGFIATISLKAQIPQIDYHWKSTFDFQFKHIKRVHKENNFYTEQFTSSKLLSEKLWIDNDEYFIVTDGLITNIDELCKAYRTSDYEALIRKLCQEYTDFFQYFTGNFVGFVWNKKNNTFIAFNNHSGTKKLHYYRSDEFLIFSTDLYTLSKTIEQLNISKSLDIEASYLLLTSGFMHDDYTLIKEIKQIVAGRYAVYSNGRFDVKAYYDLSEIQENRDTENEIINKLDMLFEKAIHAEFNVDTKLKLTPMTTLSGGLDSRMVALFAHDLKYQNQELLNFSEKGYADDVIAHAIASQYKIKINQFHLTPKALSAIDDVVAVNDGLTLYTGSGHTFEALKNIESEQVGIVHTGMIGDAVLGSFLSTPFHKKPAVSDGLYSRFLLDKVRPTLERSISQHKNEVLYKFYNRAFSGANNGFLFFDLIGESMSPFLYPAFLSYALSIPASYCYRAKIYIKWIKTKRPGYARFKWEAIGGKPTNNEFLRFIYRSKRAVVKRLPYHSMWKNTMSPEQLWYDNDTAVKKYLDDYFSENIDKFDFQKELKTDMIKLYTAGKITEKTQVLTLLSAYKLHFES